MVEPESVQLPMLQVIVWYRFTHRIEERPFLGVGSTLEEAQADAERAAKLHWDLGESNMGLVRL